MINHARRTAVAIALSALAVAGTAVAAPTIATAQTNKGSNALITVDVVDGSIVINSSKDLSNVVTSVSGSPVKYDGLSGKTLTLPLGEINTVWVKSGNNASGEGPGYGERFDIPGTAVS